MNQKHWINKKASAFEVTGITPELSKVILFYDDENAFVAENGADGYTMELFCPSATQEMADKILESAGNYVHKGFMATDVELGHNVELGDWLYINGDWYRLAKRDLSFGPASLSTASSPGEEVVDHEYHYLTPTQKAIKRKVSVGKSYYGTKIDRAHGFQIVKTNSDGTETSRAIMNSDTLAFYDADGNPSIYFDAETGKYNFYGDVTVTGGSININDNFVVDENGNVNMSGSIKLSGVIEWGDSSPYRSQFSVDGETDWHSVMTSEDMYRRDSYDGGENWGESYKFRGQDGSDADVPSYIKSTYISKTEIRSPIITGNEIRALGSFQVGYGSADDFTGTGFMGFAEGLDALGNVTKGVALSNGETLEEGDNYVIVTDGGVRMQAGTTKIYATSDSAHIVVGSTDFKVLNDGVYINGTKIG